MKTQAALCAQAIRKELKQNFPSIKFAVTSRNFAGGNAVDIEWTDGVTTKEVEKIVNKYQYGHFDGMQDLYEYSNTRNDIPQAKYIQTRRDCSPETEQKIIQQVMRDYGLAEWNDEISQKTFHTWANSKIWREFQEMTIN